MSCKKKILDSVCIVVQSHFKEHKVILLTEVQVYGLLKEVQNFSTAAQMSSLIDNQIKTTL